MQVLKNFFSALNRNFVKHALFITANIFAVLATIAFLTVFLLSQPAIDYYIPLIVVGCFYLNAVFWISNTYDRLKTAVKVISLVLLYSIPILSFMLIHTNFILPSGIIYYCNFLAIIFLAVFTGLLFAYFIGAIITTIIAHHKTKSATKERKYNEC